MCVCDARVTRRKRQPTPGIISWRRRRRRKRRMKRMWVTLFYRNTPPAPMCPPKW